MADYYMQIKIDGSEVKGEAVDQKHKDWIFLKSISFNIAQPTSTSASQGGAKPEGRCVHSELTITKDYDASSPKLSLACSAGKRVDEAVIELCRDKGEKVCYLKITL
jgi:type VI secretion system secreted protein Hcp